MTRGEPGPTARLDGSPKRENAILVTAALATMLAPLNSTMIAIALPDIMAEFAAGIATTGWLITGYLVIMAALQPVAGKIGDRFGRRRLVLVGLIGFGIASLGATVSPTLPALVLFRLVQAMAGAIALPNAAALVRESLPAARRASGFGIVGSAAGIAAAVGPPLGGILVGMFGWRSIFFANVPLVICALVLGWLTIPRFAPQRSMTTFDWKGAVLLTALLLGLVALLTVGMRLLGVTILLGAIGLIGLALVFIRGEMAHPDPVLRPSLLLHRAFASASGAVATSNLAMYTMLLAMPLLLSQRAGWSGTQIGLLLSSMSIGMAIFTPIGGRLADRFGRRWSTVGGLAILTIAVFPLALGESNRSTIAVLGSLLLAGIGLGISSAPMQTAAIESVRADESGGASGLYSTSRYLGSIVGSIILATLLGMESGSTNDGFDYLFIIIACAAASSAVISLGLHDWPSPSDRASAPIR